MLIVEAPGRVSHGIQVEQKHSDLVPGPLWQASPKVVHADLVPGRPYKVWGRMKVKRSKKMQPITSQHPSAKKTSKKT